MSQGIQSVNILELSSRKLVEATLRLEMNPLDLLQVEATWGPSRWKFVQNLLQSGASIGQLPQHFHWSWANKKSYLQRPGYQCLGIDRDNEIQGLMMISTLGKQTRIPSGSAAPIVYIEFVETAPWNSFAFTQSPRYGSIGIRLMQAAVRSSFDQGYLGRIGLHSLPQAEGYYRSTCGMTDFGIDPSYENLRYFEMTRNQAQEFLLKRFNQ